MTNQRSEYSVSVSQPPASVGFLGLGAMGLPMAGRIAESGRELVVHNRSSKRAAALRSRGVATANSPSELASRADIVLSCLLDSAAVEEVYLGPGGLVNASRPGQVFVEHGTFDPALAVRIEQALAANGAAFLDAPVTGGPEGARSGKLNVMVGGDAVTLSRCRPVLECYSARVRWVGPSGSALRLKLVNQMLVSSHLVAAAEALAVLRSLPIDLDVAAEILTTGWAASAMLTRAFERNAEPPDSPSSVHIAGLLQPQSLALAMAEQLAVPTDLLAQVHSRFRAADAAGFGQRDVAAFYSFILKDDG